MPDVLFWTPGNLDIMTRILIRRLCLLFLFLRLKCAEAGFTSHFWTAYIPLEAF